MFLISFIVASINLGLNINSSEDQSLDLKMVKASYDKVSYTINLRMLVRVLSNIAQGYEPNVSEVLPNRFSNY